MSPDIQKRAAEIADEVMRRWDARTGTQEFSMAREAAELALSGWTPPDPISPRVLAAREWLKGNHTAGVAPTIDRGEYDRNFEVSAFLAGFAAAVKLAESVVDALDTLANSIFPEIRNAPLNVTAREVSTTYRQSIGDTPHEGQ